MSAPRASVLAKTVFCKNWCYRRTPCAQKKKRYKLEGCYTARWTNYDEKVTKNRSDIDFITHPDAAPVKAPPKFNE